MKNHSKIQENKKYKQPIVDTGLMRQQLQMELNSKKLEIDRTIFSKTEEEKEELRQVKLDWRKEQRRINKVA